MNLIPELRFPEFEKNGEWEEKVLSDVSDITNGKANAQDHIEGGEYPLFDRSEVIKASDKFLFDCEAVIIPGEGMRFVPKYYEGKFNLHQRAYALKDFSCNGQFVYHSMLHRSNLISQKAVQSTVLSLRLPILQNFPIEIPRNSEEQQKIASCLSSLDELIAAHKDKLDALKDHKKGLLQNLFPQEGETVPKVRFPEFEDDGEWVEDKLSNCADVVDPHPSHRAPIAVSDGIPFIGIGDISEQGELNLKNVRLVPREILDEHRERYRLKIGDFAYGRVASVGKVVDLSKNIDKDYTYSPTMAIVQPKRINASFLRHLCNSSSFITQVIAKTSGSTRKSIGMQNLRILNISMPSSLEEQQKIASCLSALDEIIVAQTDKIEQLQQHKKGLMQGLFPKMTD